MTAGRYQITLLDTGERFPCDSHQSVLHGLARLGKRGIPVGCRGGGCGVCKVEVVQGHYHKKPMSRSHVTVEDEACGRVLACRIHPAADLQLKVVGKLRKAVNGGAGS